MGAVGQRSQHVHLMITATFMHCVAVWRLCSSRPSPERKAQHTKEYSWKVKRLQSDLKTPLEQMFS